MSTMTLTVHKRDLAWGLALVVLLSSIWVARSDLADAGGSPPGIGIAVVYVTVGTNYPDALGVGPGAGAESAPIIILPTHPPVPGDTATELVRLDPRTVIIIGGTAAISAAMETALGSLLPNAAISRIAGDDRYETNAAFSAATFPVEGWASVHAVAFQGQFPAANDVFLGESTFNTSTGILVAPIQLPHGAEIIELVVAASDADAVDDISVTLFRQLDGTNSESIATASTTGQDGPQRVSDTTMAAGKATVDNEHYGYWIYVVGADSNQVINNVYVKYRLGVSTG